MQGDRNMNTINFYGKDYIMTDEIILDCGCKYKKDNCELGISYSNIFFCELHTYKIDLEDFKQQKINALKRNTFNELSKTDYKILKHVEGKLSDEDYESEKINRQAIRDKFNDMESKISSVKTLEELNNI
jgi:hypothetical protein